MEYLRGGGRSQTWSDLWKILSVKQRTEVTVAVVCRCLCCFVRCHLDFRGRGLEN